MIIKITSENPFFNSLMEKNPNSFQGIQLRELKNGIAIGRVISDHEYHMVFQDTKYSFSEDSSNQIDFQSYCNPRVFLNLASLFLRNFFVDKDKYFSKVVPWLERNVEALDTPHKHKLTVENIYVDGFNMARGFILSKYYPEVKLTYKSKNLYTLEIESDKTLYHVINLAMVVCLYLATSNYQPWYLHKEICAKYAKILKNLSPVPYFVLYLFARKCIPTKAIFDELKPELFSAYSGDIELEWGSTQDMRLDSIRQRLFTPNNIPSDATQEDKDLLEFANPTLYQNVIEIGCGEMDYPRRFLKHMHPNYTWCSHDLTDYTTMAKTIQERTGKKFIFTQDFDQIPLLDDPSIIMIEMIEHMEYQKAKELVSTTIKKFSPAKLIITTPNYSFNQYFGFEEGRNFRHDDHQFELTTEEFKKFITDVVPKNYNIEFFGIGDKIDGESLSLGVEIRRIK